MTELWQFASLRKEKAISHGVSGKNISTKEEFLKNLDIQNYVMSGQVHGDKIYIAEKSGEVEGYDALVTVQRNLALIIKVADCLPILLYDKKLQIIAAVHAGRKGTELGITDKTIELLKTTYAADPENMLCGFGPAICKDCYQIDRANNIHYDLGNENLNQLLAAGVLRQNIELSMICTSCNGNNKFYSYRKDQTEKRNYCFIYLTR